MFLSTRSASALLLVALAASVHAQADTVTFFRTTIHNQTSATNSDELGTFLATGISVFDAGRYGAATLYLPDGTTTYPLAQTGTEYDYNSPLFDTRSELEAAFPHGNYTFALDAGSGPAAAISLTDAQDRWSPEVPLAMEYDALQAATAGQGFTIHVAGFTPGDGTNDDLSFYVLHDNTTDLGVFDGRSASTAAYSFDIAPGLLVGGHSYTLTLYYSSRFDIPNAGLDGATAYDAYDQLTTVNFTAAPVPEPASLGALGVGVVAFLRRRRR